MPSSTVKPAAFGSGKVLQIADYCICIFHSIYTLLSQVG